MPDPVIDDRFRPAWEWASIAAWSLVAAGLTTWILWVPAPAMLFGAAVFCCLCGLRDLPSALRLRKRHRQLRGVPMRFGTLIELEQRMHSRPDAIWIGHGFGWGREHAQMAQSMSHHDHRGQPDRNPSQRKGLPWIHGLGELEMPVWLPTEFARGHTLIVGTTGSGKTRLLENLLTQAILRHEAVLILDPKGDRALQQTARAACEFQNRAERFFLIDRANPAGSARLNPLAHFQSASELASRVAGLMGGGTTPDVFSGFSQKTLKAIIEALLELGTAPTLKALRRQVEGGVEEILFRLLSRRFEGCFGAEWLDRVVPGPAAHRSVSMKEGQALYANAPELAPGFPGPGAPALRDLTNTWRRLRPHHPELHSVAIESLIGVMEHDRTHAQKLLAGLLPILQMLSTGELGAILSPESDDQHDTRPVIDLDEVIAARGVVYIGLDGLSDPLVAAAFGRLLMADLASLAGAVYQRASPPIPVSCYVDEAAECLSESAIALLNKGRGAGFSMTLLTQTFADFVAASGSEAKARQILGNTNNLVCLRVRDFGTQIYVAEQMPQVPVLSLTHSQSAGNAPWSPMTFNGQASETLLERRSPLVDPCLLGALPDLEGFVHIAGGLVYKVAIPILQTEPCTRRPEHRDVCP